MTAPALDRGLAMAADRLDGADGADDTRARSLRDLAGPLDLACELNPATVRTPALELISAALEDAIVTPGKRVIISVPPQEGKSEISRYAVVRKLQRDPHRRCAIASYGADLAVDSGRKVRQLVDANGSRASDAITGTRLPDALGIAVSHDHGAAGNWSLAGHEGGLYCIGVGGGLTGRPVDGLFIVDDPIKDMKSADSDAVRNGLWSWWTSVGEARLGPTTSIVVIQCMTGDTPVLMADGREKPLRNIRPGDSVATYDEGKVATSTVRNWANQGPDAIYSIRMKSGRVVRANARHPFLTVEGGELVWRRTDTLRPGSVIQSVTGGSGAESPAQLTDATPRPGVKACAPRTTTRSAGPTDIDLRPPTRPVAGQPTSSTGTGSPPSGTTPSSSSRAGGAPSAASTPPSGTPALTGTGSSASITTTTPGVFVGCSATTAISSPGTASPRPSSAPPLSTWRPEPDTVVEVVPCGVEDVFDLQIDRTENFIANGLVSHNTRWHEEDLAGRLIAADAEMPPGEQEWQVINIPALADGQTDDALDRPPGEWLTSARRRTDAQWTAIRRRVGERVFAALYQGRPAPLEGGIFRQEWIDAHRADQAPAELLATCVAVDPADTGLGDAAGILVGSRTGDGQIWVRADLSGQLSQGEWARRACLAAVRFGADTILQESNLGMGRALRDAWSVIRRQAAALHEAEIPAAAAELLAGRGDTAAADEADLDELGPLLDDILVRPSSGPCHIKAVTPRQSKYVRAHAVTGLYETGRARHVGRLPLLEHEMITWQPGQPSPNRLDTLAHLLTHLDTARVHAAVSTPKRTQATRIPTRTARDPRRGGMPRSPLRAGGR